MMDGCIIISIVDEDREVLLLLRTHLPGPWRDVCAQRLQELPFLQAQMPPPLQGQAQPPQARLDQSCPQTQQQINRQGLSLRVRKEAQLATPVQPRPLRPDRTGHEEDCRHQAAQRRPLLGKPHEIGESAETAGHRKVDLGTRRFANR